MHRLFYTSQSGMMANQNKLDLISNNIANVNTTGYKKLDAQFSDLLMHTLNVRSYPTNSTDAYKGTGVRLSEPVRNFSQGSLLQSEIRTDIAIDGNGFFRFTNKNGEYVYSRNGELNIDSSGQIVDSNGNILEINFENGMSYSNANITAENLTISKSGEVMAGDRVVGKITVYESDNTNTFISNGDNTFTSVDGDVYEVQKSVILQGYSEKSNVSMQDEMVELIKAQRAFQISAKGVRIADEMWSIANNLKSR